MSLKDTRTNFNKISQKKINIKYGFYNQIMGKI